MVFDGIRSIQEQLDEAQARCASLRTMQQAVRSLLQLGLSSDDILKVLMYASYNMIPK